MARNIYMMYEEHIDLVSLQHLPNYDQGQILWDTRHKTAIGQDFSDKKCPIFPALSMIGENP